MTVTYDLTQDDQIQFNLYHVAHSPSHKKDVMKQSLGVALVFCGIGLIEFRTKGRMSSLILAGIAAILSLVLIPLYHKAVIRKRVSEMLDEGKSPHKIFRTTVTIQDKGLERENEQTVVLVKWRSIERIEQTPEYLYLYYGAVEGMIIPKRAFVNTADCEKFLERVMAYRENAVGISSTIV